MMPALGRESEDDGIYFDDFRAIVIKLFVHNFFNEYQNDDEEEHYEDEEGENNEEEEGHEY